MQNNPFVIGGLLSILVAALVMTVAQLRGSDSGAPVVTPVPATASAAPSVRSSHHPEVPRDPFYHPALQRVLASGGPTPTAPASQPGQPTRSPLPELPSQPLPALEARPGRPNLDLRPAPVEPPLAVPHATPAAQQPADHAQPNNLVNGDSFVRGLRVTAVVSGKNRCVVVEGAGPLPLTVRAGDWVGTLRVAAIRAREMVLNADGAFWTVPIPVIPAPGGAEAAIKEDGNASR